MSFAPAGAKPLTILSLFLVQFHTNKQQTDVKKIKLKTLRPLSGGNPKYPETKETFSETGPGHGLCAHTVSLLLCVTLFVW